MNLKRNVNPSARSDSVGAAREARMPPWLRKIGMAAAKAAIIGTIAASTLFGNPIGDRLQEGRQEPAKKAPIVLMAQKAIGSFGAKVAWAAEEITKENALKWLNEPMEVQKDALLTEVIKGVEDTGFAPSLRKLKNDIGFSDKAKEVFIPLHETIPFSLLVDVGKSKAYFFSFTTKEVAGNTEISTNYVWFDLGFEPGEKTQLRTTMGKGSKHAVTTVFDPESGMLAVFEWEGEFQLKGWQSFKTDAKDAKDVKVVPNKDYVVMVDGKTIGVFKADEELNMIAIATYNL